VAGDGKRIRRKVSGKIKQEVRAKLQALHEELNAGVKSPSTYTVREAVDDWLREDLDGTSERTRALYEGLLGPHAEADDLVGRNVAALVKAPQRQAV
jgi:hypothetical protein